MKMLSSCRRIHYPGCIRKLAFRRFNSSTINHEAGIVAKTRRVILSGIQPTGVPHLGNYLGALSNWVKLQREAEPGDDLLFTIVGWHALTLPQKPIELSASRWDMLATLLAIGIDPKRSVVFHQDDNRCHIELMWILNCLTPIGKLRRMTTWKSRLADSRNANSESEIDESMLNAGLFTYPVLQAADILAYRATHVPVGDDQTQHLELSRELAQIFNKAFVPGKKAFFPQPAQVVTTSKRILSLRDPSSKMSKSSPDIQSRILLTDSYSQIASKIRSSVTDGVAGITWDPETRPGISNLLTILGACINKKPLDVARLYANRSTSEFKGDVTEAVEEMIKVPRSEFERIRDDKAFLIQTAKDGAERARERSSATMKEVRRMIGLY